METCSFCGAITEVFDGPIHEYMISSPGCWATFGKILEKEYGDPEFMKVHRLTVDSFACQHPGEDEPRANQSVIVHLVALYLALEEKIDYKSIPKIMEEVITKFKNQFPRLQAPSFNVFQMLFKQRTLINTVYW